MASISFTDVQLGKILTEYTRHWTSTATQHNTLVLFSGDHGQNAGEHNTRAKMTVCELSTCFGYRDVPHIVAVSCFFLLILFFYPKRKPDLHDSRTLLRIVVEYRSIFISCFLDLNAKHACNAGAVV